MTSEQAAQLIDDTLDLVHQRLVELEQNQQGRAQRAHAASSGRACSQRVCDPTDYALPPIRETGHSLRPLPPPRVNGAARGRTRSC